MPDIQCLDHVAFAVADIDRQVRFFTTALHMTVQSQSEQHALVADPVSGFKIELTKSDGPATQFLHLGIRAAEIDTAYEKLVAQGVTTVHPPHRREFAHMRTAFVKDAGGLEIQLVTYDES
jgi:catechol 2,3-dioxygenase-like lactoylglutathione lyase family enzyme